MARQDRKPGRARPGWDVPAGLGAIVVLLVLLAGPPVALITVFGLPIPHTMPSASLLTHRLETAAVLRACSVVVWLAWLQLVWCVVAEVSAAVRNIGMPRRVPLAGGLALTSSMPGPWASCGMRSTQPGRIRLAIVSVEPSGCGRSLFRSKISRYRLPSPR